MFCWFSIRLTNESKCELLEHRAATLLFCVRVCVFCALCTTRIQFTIAEKVYSAVLQSALNWFSPEIQWTLLFRFCMIVTEHKHSYIYGMRVFALFVICFVVIIIYMYSYFIFVFFFSKFILSLLVVVSSENPLFLFNRMAWLFGVHYYLFAIYSIK